MFQKLNTDGNSTKSNVNLVSNFKALKALCSTCPYGVTSNDLMQVENLVSFLSKLLKHSQFKMEHLQCEKMKMGENLIGHGFITRNYIHFHWSQPPNYMLSGNTITKHHLRWIWLSISTLVDVQWKISIESTMVYALMGTQWWYYGIGQILNVFYQTPQKTNSFYSLITKFC